MSNVACSVHGCGDRPRSKGLCNKHYIKLRKFGSPDAGETYHPRMHGATCSVDGCTAPARSKGLCNAHYKHHLAHGSPTSGAFRAANGSGTVISTGYRVIHADGRRVLEHVAVAESALGKMLPAGARVHHIDGDRLNNDPSNLVICPNDAYHALLHRRQEAMEATGNPNYRKCQFCKTWDAPENMHLVSLGGYHVKCRNDYKNARRSKE